MDTFSLTTDENTQCDISTGHRAAGGHWGNRQEMRIID